MRPGWREASRCSIVWLSLGTLWLVEHVARQHRSAREMYQAAARDKQAALFFPVASRVPTPLRLCPNATAGTEFAVVSLLVMNGGAEHVQYQQSLQKLAHAFRFFSNIDLVLLLVNAANAPLRLDHWRVCNVPEVKGPLQSAGNNRYLLARIYTKLRVWQLEEYKAVLYVDADTMLVRQFDSAFLHHLPTMMNLGLTIGMGPDKPGHADYFNAGVVLLVPNSSEYLLLEAGIQTVPHDPGLADQNYLNSFYRGHVYPLPFVLNALVQIKSEQPAFWKIHEPHIILYHYLVKPWDWRTCWDMGAEDLCLMWSWQ